MLIVFEGIDRAGKSTLALLFEQYLNDRFRDKDGLLKIDPHLGDFTWTKEPSFTSEEADMLNSQEYNDPFKRERIFFESRLRHQDFLSGKNVICDRYLWSGLAYSYQYSQEAYWMLRELYSSESLFMPADLCVFIDTPPEVCFDRDPILDLDRLRSLQSAYKVTQGQVCCPIITIQSIGGEQRSLDNLIEHFEKHVTDNHLLVEEQTW